MEHIDPAGGLAPLAADGTKRLEVRGLASTPTSLDCPASTPSPDRVVTLSVRRGRPTNDRLASRSSHPSEGLPSAGMKLQVSRNA